MSLQQTVLITGTSTGIGRATADVFLAKGFRVFGTVRNQSDADRLQTEFGPEFVQLIADVTDQAAVRQAAAQVGDMLGRQRLTGVVNNAGIVIGGPLLHVQASEMRRQMEVNLIGPFLAAQAFAPLLGSDPQRTGRPGRIVQISSVSGVLGIPFVGPYTASKFALEGMSESLRRELMPFGIDVIVVGPGTTVTPSLDKAAAEDYSAFNATVYGPIFERFRAFFTEEAKKGLAPKEIGRAVYRAMTDSKPNVRYAVVPQRFKNWTLPMLLPKRLLDRLLAKQFGLESQ